MNLDYLRSKGVNVDKALSLFGDVETYNLTFKDYLDGIEEKKRLLSHYKEERDWQNYGVYAHSIKSDARYLGFEHTQEVCLKHEMAGKEGREHFIKEDYDNMITEVDKMTSIIKKYMSMPIKEEVETKEVEKPTVIEEILEVPKKIVEVIDAIIVADDSPLVSNFIERSITSNYKILKAEDGLKTINYINNPNYKIKAILLDLNMPNLNGYEVLKYLTNSNKYNKIPVSVITGEDQKDRINEVFKYNVIDLLQKPFNKQDIQRVLDKTLLHNE